MKIFIAFLLFSSSINAQHIEAENYSAQSGTGKEVCVEGGQDVGSLDSGDWLEYKVTAGNYILNIRTSTPYDGQQLQINSGTTIIKNISVPNSAGWQTFKTTSTSIILSTGTIRITSPKAYPLAGSFNFNWFELVPIIQPNILPVVNAGKDTVLNYPIKVPYVLHANAYDPDGSIVSYKWTLLGTPDLAVSLTDSVQQFFSQTDYNYEIMVTDNRGGVSRDTIKLSLKYNQWSQFAEIPLMPFGTTKLPDGYPLKYVIRIMNNGEYVITSQ